MRDDAGYRGVLRMRGLPFSTVVDEVLDFFGQSAALKRENVHLMRRADGRASGDAYAVFDTEEAAVAALSFDKQKLGTRSLRPSPSPSPSPSPNPSPDPDQSLDEARRASSLFFCEARTGFTRLQTVAVQG